MIGKASSRLNWPPLLKGTLLRRYKRFIADVTLQNGHVVAAHCPNSGSMAGCSEPGRPVYLSRQDGPRRKLKYTWKLIDMPTSLVGIDTLVPNRLVQAAVQAETVPQLKGYKEIRTEVRYGENSRVDLLLEKDDQRCFLEVKNCTLVLDRTAYFPDAVTSRGLKHLVELQHQVRRGHRAVMFYLVQRMDAKTFSPADHIDPDYGRELRKAVKNGVEMVVYDVHIDLHGIEIQHSLPWKL